jgi:hypothetical protein
MVKKANFLPGVKKRKKADAKHKAAQKAYREVAFHTGSSLKLIVQAGRPGSKREH